MPNSAALYLLGIAGTDGGDRIGQREPGLQKCRRRHNIRRRRSRKAVARAAPAREELRAEIALERHIVDRHDGLRARLRIRGA